MKRLLTLAAAFILLSITPVKAQLQVTPTNNGTTLAQTLLGSGVTISNITVNCPSAAAGTFSNGNSTNLGLNSGLVLTTGTSSAIAQSSAGFASTDNTNGTDADLNSITNVTTQDICALQFTCVPQGNILTFRYVFGSEEYPEYVCSNFNDVFGFFISGPIPGGGNYNKNNIALIPGTGLSVSINTVNPGVPGANYSSSGCQSLAYSGYYVNNGGTTIVYDGFTTVLTASIAVIPCQTYTLKLAVGDAGDGIYDSGVFLEAGSFVSNPPTVTATVDAGFSNTFEGCVGGHFTINVPNLASSSTPIQYTISGTATNGTDYPLLNGTAYVNPGTSTALVYVNPNTDNITEGTETVTLTVLDPCTGQPVSSATINIQDPPAVTATASSTLVCSGAQVQLTATGGGTYSWTPTSGLSCTTCPNPVATVDSTVTYNVDVTFGTCVSTKSVTINSNKLSIGAQAVPNTTVCPNTPVTIGASLSGGSGTVTYQWSPAGTLSDPQAAVTTATPAVTTTYTVTATDQAGCTAQDQVTVPVYVLPAVNLGPNQTLCWNAGPVTLTPSGGPWNSYSWSTGETTSSITVSTGGTYGVTVVDPSNGCSVTATPVTITYRPQTQGPLADATICPGSNTTLSADPSFTNVSWSDGSTGNTITVSTAGDFSYTANDANGCLVISDTATVTLLNATSVNPTASPDTICSGGSSTLDANAPGATGYSWSTGGTTQTITVNAAGTYTVTVTNGTCTASGSISVYQYPTINVSIGSDTTVCNGQSVVLTPSGGPYVSYNWSTGETTSSITAAIGGTYNVTVNDGNCSFVSNTINLTILPAVITTLPDTSTCLGVGIPLTAAVGLTNITWSTGETTPVIVVSASGDYSYTATDVNGCNVVSDTATVSYLPGLTVNITASPDTICVGGSTILTSNATGSAPGLNINWNTGETTTTITVTAPGDYSVTVSGGSCPAVSDTITIYQYPQTPAVLSNDTTVCPGTAVNVDIVSGGPYVSYAWNTGETTASISTATPGSYWVIVNDGNCEFSSDTFVLSNFVVTNPPLADTGTCQGAGDIVLYAGAFTGINWNTGAITDSIIVSADGDFWYTGFDANGCVVNSDTATVTFTPAPTVAPTASPDTFCVGGSSVLSANAVGATSYSWSTGETTSTITVTSAGTYSVTVSNGFCPASGSVTVYQYPQIQVNIGNDTTVCSGQSITLAPNGGPYATYNWSTGETTTSITVSTAGSYTLTVNDGNCNYTSNTVILSNYPVTTPALADAGACTGDSVTLTATGNLTNITWNTGATTTSITVYTSGDYSFTATDANGCTAVSDTSTVTFGPTPTPAVTASPDSICAGGSSTLDAGTSGVGYTYNWSNGGTQQTTTVNAAGTYTVTVTSGTCSATGSVNVGQYTHAPVTLNNDTTVCAGSSVTLTPSGSPYVSYNWSNGATTPTITVTTAGSYSVTVNDGHCTYVSNTFTLGNYPVQHPNLPDTTVCQGTPISLSAAGGLTNINWNTGATTTSISVTTNGTYWYSANDANGCNVQSDTSLITFTPAPTVAPDASPDTICQGGSSTINANATGTNLTYSWSTTETTPSIVVGTAGTYTVTVSSGQCSATGSITVYQNNHGPVLLNNDTTVCHDVAIVVAPSGGPYVSYAWSNGQTMPTITVTTAGNYLVTVNDGTCTYFSDVFTLQLYPASEPEAHNDTTLCDGQSAVLTADPGFTNYVWSNNQTGSSITVSTAGSYSYSATDLNGCPAVSTAAVVTTSASPHPDITASPAAICIGQGVTTLDAGAEQGSTYLWSPSGATTQTIQVLNPTTYYVTATLNGCTAVDSITLTGSNPPSISLPVTTTTCCSAVTLSPGSNQGYTYVWNDNSTDSVLVINSTNNTAANYSVTVTDANGCSATAEATVYINCINATVSAMPDTVRFGDSTLLTATVDYEGSFTYSWTPVTGVSSPNTATTNAAPQDVTTYTLTVVDDSTGCADTTDITVYVLFGAEVKMPNAFTPNGDGHNDLFGPVYSGPGATIADFKIYDRWGALIHNSTNFWDGQFKSADQPSGTYVYYIVVRVPDDSNFGQTKDVEIHGSFTLIR
ncbi:MAG: choice-of-anchor L domain-containing protein [Chitinophagales bacterium]